MAKQEGREQQGQGSALQPSGKARTGVFPATMMLAPGDLFRMGPFALLRRMSEEMDRVFGEFGLNRGEGGKEGWAPAIEVSQPTGNISFAPNCRG